jgi:large subunit ribosomal protein L25
MAAERVSLDVRVRDERGSAAARRLRKTGFIPGVVYGGNAEPTAISVGERELRKALTTDGREAQRRHAAGHPQGVPA